MKIDLDHIYLLGWHSIDGKRNLTSWTNNNKKIIDVVVIGATDNDMKHIMWSAPLHNDFKLIKIPALTNRLTFAKMNNGLHAFGWYFEDGVSRPPMRKLCDDWDWLTKIRGV